MNKYFRLLAGMKFFCAKDGSLTKNSDGQPEIVPEDFTGELEEVVVADDTDENIAKLISDVSTKATLEATKNATDSATKAVTKLVDAIADHATKKTDSIVAKTVSSASFDVAKVEEGLKAIATGNAKSFSFDIRGAEDLKFLVKTTSEGGSLTGDVIEGQRVPEITRDPVRTVFIESIADVVSNMTSDHLSYVETVTESGAPIMTAELEEMGEKDFTMQEFKAYLKKITVTNNHSVEILEDASQLVNAIKGWLAEDVNIVTDSQLLNGSGIGDNLTGVITVAAELDETAIGTKRVSNANLMDVIRVAITKITVAGKGKFNATHVLLNPEDADALDLTKGVDGHYIIPPFKSADGTVIKGARVIENVGITEGEFLVGDFRKLHIGTKGGLRIEMTNSHNGNFTKDILTVKIVRRVASYVRQNDNGAFYTGNISDVIEFLTAS